MCSLDTLLLFDGHHGPCSLREIVLHADDQRWRDDAKVSIVIPNVPCETSIASPTYPACFNFSFPAERSKDYSRLYYSRFNKVSSLIQFAAAF